MLVFGTRPEAIKMCPLVNEMKKRKDFKSIVCVTGQHREMLQQVLDIFEVVPDYNLDIMQENQDLFDITNRILSEMRDVLTKERPDVVLVHGDTTTTFATSLSCFYLGIAVGHVEAGLRTYDLKAPFPEEFNRQVTGIVTKYHFAPTEWAKNNLIKEGKRQENVYVVGNTVIDALKTTVSDTYWHEELEWAKDSKIILTTVHRRENWGKPLDNILLAIKKILDKHGEVKVIFPMHKNPKIREKVINILGDNKRVHLIEPLDVFDFHNFIKHSYLILSDSGGVQEEAPSLGKPVLVLRETTERPEGVAAGTIKLLGNDIEKIYNEVDKLLNNFDEYSLMANAVNPYGDGTTSEKIADILEKSLCISNE